MIAPMLVPTTRSGLSPRLSMISSTPMCANPLAPPPESTSAVFAGAHVCARASRAAKAERNRELREADGASSSESNGHRVRRMMLPLR